MKSESGKEIREHALFSRKLIVAAVLVGIFLIWVGQLVATWLENRVDAFKISTTLISLGSMISGGALIGGGVINESIDKFVRLGMLVVAALIIMQMPTWGIISSILWGFGDHPLYSMGIWSLIL